MSKFDPQKLFTNVIPPANFVHPVEGRKYTLTHSDATAELFLDIGYVYNLKAIDWEMRDEVLAEWQKDTQCRFRLVGLVYIDAGKFSEEEAGYRFNIFQKEMRLALKGIVNGDLPFFAQYPQLLDAPIYIIFDSIYPQYNQVLFYGTPRQYIV